MITDERLKWLSNPDYAKSEPGQVAAELLVARERVKALEAALREISAVATGERQVADDDTGGLEWIYAYIVDLGLSAETDAKAELAKRIAREIFLVGDEYGEKVHRIQFMLGNIQTERPGGGLGEGPLESVIRRVLHAVNTEGKS